MVRYKTTGDKYMEIDAKVSELMRQLRQSEGSKHNPALVALVLDRYIREINNFKYLSQFFLESLFLQAGITEIPLNVGSRNLEIYQEPVKIPTDQTLAVYPYPTKGSSCTLEEAGQIIRRKGWQLAGPERLAAYSKQHEQAGTFYTLVSIVSGKILSSKGEVVDGDGVCGMVLEINTKNKRSLKIVGADKTWGKKEVDQVFVLVIRPKFTTELLCPDAIPIGCQVVDESIPFECRSLDEVRLVTVPGDTGDRFGNISLSFLCAIGRHQKSLGLSCLPIFLDEDGGCLKSGIMGGKRQILFPSTLLLNQYGALGVPQVFNFLDNPALVWRESGLTVKFCSDRASIGPDGAAINSSRAFMAVAKE